MYNFKKLLVKILEIFLFLMFIMLVVFHIPMPEAKEVVLQYHAISYHADRDKNFNEKNTGLSLRYYNDSDLYDFLTIGTYKNSDYKQSHYAGMGWSFKKSKYITFNLTAGVVTGYDNKVFPFITPSVQIFDAVHLHGIAYPKAVVGISIDVVKVKF